VFSHPCLTRTGTGRVPNPLPKSVGNESGHRPVSGTTDAIKSVFESGNHPLNTRALPQQVDSKFLLQNLFLLSHPLYQLYEVKQLSVAFNHVTEKPDSQIYHDIASYSHIN